MKFNYLKYRFFLFLTGTIFFLFQLNGYGNSISIIKLKPASPANLTFGQQINISFDFDISYNGGARIYIRPITASSISPNYSASASQIYRGKGRGSGSFTIRTGELVKVDQLRLQMFNADRTQLIFEFCFPVDYTFSKLPLNLTLSQNIINPKVVLNDQKMKEKQQNQNIHEVQPVNPKIINPKISPNAPEEKEGQLDQNVQGTTRKILPNGSVEISFPDGKIERRFKGGKEIFYPEKQLSQKIMFSTGARAAIPPSLPNDLELPWMEEHSNKLLEIIKSLVNQDSTSITNYLQFEGDLDIYEQIVKREETIYYLIQP